MVIMVYIKYMLHFLFAAIARTVRYLFADSSTRNRRQMAAIDYDRNLILIKWYDLPNLRQYRSKKIASCWNRADLVKEISGMTEIHKIYMFRHWPTPASRFHGNHKQWWKVFPRRVPLRLCTVFGPLNTDIIIVSMTVDIAILIVY